MCVSLYTNWLHLGFCCLVRCSEFCFVWFLDMNCLWDEAMSKQMSSRAIIFQWTVPVLLRKERNTTVWTPCMKQPISEFCTLILVIPLLIPSWWQWYSIVPYSAAEAVDGPRLHSEPCCSFCNLADTCCTLTLAVVKERVGSPLVSTKGLALMGVYRSKSLTSWSLASGRMSRGNLRCFQCCFSVCCFLVF